VAHLGQHRLQHGAEGHRLEADGRALSQRAVEDVKSKNPESDAVSREREGQWR